MGWADKPLSTAVSGRDPPLVIVTRHTSACRTFAAGRTNLQGRVRRTYRNGPRRHFQ